MKKLNIKKYIETQFFNKIDKNISKKYRFDEISKTQMPEGTLNRTFCLPKINFSLFFRHLFAFLAKKS